MHEVNKYRNQLHHIYYSHCEWYVTILPKNMFFMQQKRNSILLLARPRRKRFICNLCISCNVYDILKRNSKVEIECKTGHPLGLNSDWSLLQLETSFGAVLHYQASDSGSLINWTFTDYKGFTDILAQRFWLLLRRVRALFPCSQVARLTPVFLWFSQSVRELLDKQVNNALNVH